MVVSMEMTVFWDVVTCRMVLMMEAVSTSEMVVSFYQTIWCNIPEDSHLQETMHIL
jgi:hypothetical protein